MIGNIIGGIASAIGAFLTVWGERMRENNTPEMLKNNEAKKRLAMEEKFERDMDKGDLETARKDDAHP